MVSFENLERILNLLNLQNYLDLFKENKLDDEEIQNGISLEEILGLGIVLGDARKIARKFQEVVQISKEKNSLNDWIKLNVGGTIFQTTRSTLIKEPDSMLSAMFDPNSNFEPGKKDSSEAILIDRDPKYFGPILNFLRTGSVILDYNLNKEGILKEAEFFGINSIIPHLDKLEDKLSLEKKKLEQKKKFREKQLEREKELEVKKLEFEKEKWRFDKTYKTCQLLKSYKDEDFDSFSSVGKRSINAEKVGFIDRVLRLAQ